jgi:hypothetical protein
MGTGTRRGARWLAGVWAVAVVLAATVMAGPAQAETAPFIDSSVAWTGHTAVVAAVNTAGNLDYYYQQDGSTTWNQEVVAKCCSTYTTDSPPSIAQTGSTVSIADSGEGGKVNYYYEYDGICLIRSQCPPGWHKQVVATAPGGTAYGPATISGTDNTVIIAADDGGGGSGAPSVLDYWWERDGTTTWHEEQVATGVGAFPSIGWTGSTVIITDTDAHGNLDYWYQDAGTRPWHQQRVAPAGSLGNNGGGFWSFPAISWTGSTVIIAAVNEDGDLDYWHQHAGSWLQQQVAGPGSVDVGGPAIAWTGSSVVLAGVTESGSLNFWVQAAGTRPWHYEHVATLSQAGGEFFPPSMAAAGGHVVITDSDGSDVGFHSGGNLDYWWKRVGTTDWHQQQVAAG